MARDDPVVEAHALLIDVTEERLEGEHALSDAARESVPFDRADDPRDEVQRERTLLAVVGKRDPALAERAPELVEAVLQLAFAVSADFVDDFAIDRSGFPRGAEHFIPGDLGINLDVRRPHAQSYLFQCF